MLSARRSIHWLLATTFLMGIPLSGRAEEPGKAAPVAARHSYDIPAKPLGEALSEIGYIAGVSIAASEPQLFGLKSRPVRGDMTARQALDAALAGSGIRYRFRNARAVALDLARMKGFEANAQASGDLPTIDVQGGTGNSVGYIATRTTTATKTDTPLINVPQAVTVVTKQQVQDIGAQRLEDVVRYVPGVVWHQGEGNRDQVVLRGQSTSADFFVDGVRDDAQVFRDLYNLERVEVLKGPGGMAFGRGGPHMCLGNSLARMEIQIMFEDLLARPFDVQPNGEIEYLRSNFVHWHEASSFSDRHAPASSKPIRRITATSWPSGGS